MNSKIYLNSRPRNEHLKIWKEDFDISVVITLENNEHVGRIKDFCEKNNIQFLNVVLPPAKE